MKSVLAVASWLFIIAGVLFFFFLRMLNDPEVEGESGRISIGTYFISLIPIAIGALVLIFMVRKPKN